MRKFVVKNVSLQKKSVSVFGFSLPYKASVDVLKLSHIKVSDLEKSLDYGGEIFKKIKNKDLVVLEDKLIVKTNILPKVIINDDYVYAKINVQQNLVDETFIVNLQENMIDKSYINEDTFSTVHDEVVPYVVIGKSFEMPYIDINVNIGDSSSDDDIEEDKDSFINLLDVEPEVEEMVVENKVPKLNKVAKPKQNTKAKKQSLKLKNLLKK